jgi:predicted ester cyclase
VPPDETDGLVRRFYEQLWNRWDDGAVEGILAADFEFQGSLGTVTRGRDEWRGYRDGIRAAVPDFHNEIIELVVSGPRAAARLVYTGHHHGILLGHRGHGAPIRYEGAAFFHGDRGRLAAAWVLGDLDGLRRQLDRARLGWNDRPPPTGGVPGR